MFLSNTDMYIIARVVHNELKVLLERREQSSLRQLCLQLHLSQQQYENIDALVTERRGPNER